MAVTVLNSDPNHAILHAIVTAAQTAANNVPSTSTNLKSLANDRLRQAQVDEVVHCMNSGRLNPATILSTLS